MTAAATAFSAFRESLDQLADGAPGDELSDQERVARARAAFLAGLDRRTAVDLDTCIHCGMCAEACHFYIATGDDRYTPAYKVEPLRRFYRRELSPLRFLYRPFTRKLDAAELSEWRELVYEACTGCGRCDMMCPMGINISSGINLMREALAAAGLAPAELAALQREQRQDNTVFGVDADALRSVIATLAAEGITVPLDEPAADILVLTTAVEVKLFPGAIGAIAKIMQRTGASWTVSSGAFEAANVGLISGDVQSRNAAIGRIAAAAAACGASTIVVPESGHAYQALRWEAANALGETPSFEVLAIAEYVAAAVNDGKLSFAPMDGKPSVAYHDPCRLARHGGVFDEPRAVLTALGYELRETDSNRRENLCCGGGCGEYTIGHSAPIRQRAFELKRHELDDTKAHAVVTGCNNCRVNLMIGAENSGWDKPVVSLVETVADRISH